MNVYAGAAFVGLVGLMLCLIPFVLTTWGVAHVRRDVRAARRLGRVMIATSALSFPILLWIALPDYFQVTFGGPLARILDGVPNPILVPIAGVIAYFIGLGWMVRIYRTSHLEPAGSSWRYRDSFR